MNVKDFINNYNMHDSLIDKIDINEDHSLIDLFVDFAFWMQKDYNENCPETGKIKITFYDVVSYNIPENINWDEISILETRMEDEKIKILLINDMTDEYLEIIIQSNVISVDWI